jgi:hypothetical protein
MLTILLLLAALVIVFALWFKGDVRAGFYFAGVSFFLEAKERKRLRGNDSSIARPPRVISNHEKGLSTTLQE